MSEHTVVDLAGGLQGRCPPATTTDELLCVVFGGHAELQPTRGEDNVHRLAALFTHQVAHCAGSNPFLHSMNTGAVRHLVCGENGGERRNL
ncbi:hypothetical protein ACV1BL_16775 [Serratia marcescens]